MVHNEAHFSVYSSVKNGFDFLSKLFGMILKNCITPFITFVLSKKGGGW